MGVRFAPDFAATLGWHLQALLQAFGFRVGLWGLGNVLANYGWLTQIFY